MVFNTVISVVFLLILWYNVVEVDVIIASVFFIRKNQTTGAHKTKR